MLTSAMNSGDEPLVSVIMPAYNCAAFVAEAIDSVLEQDYAGKELIVVNDGSTDATAEQVARFGARVRLIEQPNRGPAAARNRGVIEARGRYLAFLDGDDVWLPGKLATQMAYLREHPEVKIVFTGFARWLPERSGAYPPAREFAAWGAKDVIGPEYSGYLYATLLLDSVIHIITAIIERAAFSGLGGFDENLRVGEDYEFWMRASRVCPAHKIDQIMALYRMQPESATRSAPRAVSHEYVVLSQTLERFGTAGPDGRQVDEAKLRARLGDLCFAHGYRHFWHGDPWIAAQAFKQSMRYSGFALRVASYAAASLARSFFSRHREAQ
jgi:glycosyltransferase involved in cell wall biosynthesis